MKLLSVVFSLLIAAFSAFAQEPAPADSMKNCPMHRQHIAQSHQQVVREHGEEAMGFSQKKTTHHFRLFDDGGSIQVTANRADDDKNVQAIRMHLAHIATMFADGDFSAPMFVHEGVPPGVTTMKLMKAAIRYNYEEIPKGGRVRIVSKDAVAVAAVHEFLRFQIQEHQTGDSLELSKN